jgi:hypothetical protein
MTTASSTTFRVDTLHPSHVLCERCGEPVCELPTDSEVMEHAGGLTTRQAAAVWPEQGDTIRLHAVLSDWRRASSRADVPVYVRVTEGDAD